jgi:hypothetical protein
MKSQHNLGVPARRMIRRAIKTLKDRYAYVRWVASGNPLPPPHIVKQRVIQEYQTKHNIRNFVETGTYLGDMVEVQCSKFDRVFSIELDRKLHKRAIELFRDRSHVRLLQGDSGELLREVMPELNGTALFWLDGHYSGGITARGVKDCPIFEELECIFEKGAVDKHVLLVDDARCFNGEHGYPTIQELRAFLEFRNIACEFDVKDDIIRIEVL